MAVVLGFSGIANGDEYQRRYGLRFVGHDAAAALVVDGRLVFAAEEERFSRAKHTSSLPVNAVRAALAHAGLALRDVDVLAYTWEVSLAKYLRMCLYHVPQVPLRHAPSMALAGVRVVRDMMVPSWAARRLGAALGEQVPRCEGVAHHMGHASVAYLASPFDAAATLTIDGQGEDESATLGEWTGDRYRTFRSIRSPDSIGILYGMVTDFLGLRAAWDEYKVMAMASMGDPARFRAAFAELVQLDPAGGYHTHRTAMVFQPGWCDRMLRGKLGIEPRASDAPFEQVHFDLAAALQETTERVVFHLLRELRAKSASRNLCMAGGVALNSVCNGKVLRSGLFERVWIPPVPGDHGGALGAALLVAQRGQPGQRIEAAFTVFSGPDATEESASAAIARRAGELHVERPDDLVRATADLLASGAVIGWCQGRMEYGPRALGHRSLLASPVDASMRDRVNARIKHREAFRPFGGSVPLDRAAEIFELDGASPYMQFVVPVRAAWRERIPAVLHQETCRVQTVAEEDDPLFHALLGAFGRLTGVPVLLNTSFNDRDEPIVCTAEDALRSFLRMDLDAVVIGRSIVRRA